VVAGETRGACGSGGDAPRLTPIARRHAWYDPALMPDIARRAAVTLFVAAIVIVCARSAGAQTSSAPRPDARFAFSAIGLASWQPGDDRLVPAGIDRSLSGIAGGFGGSFDMALIPKTSAIVEITTARLTKTMSVVGLSINDQVRVSSRDTVLSFLAGRNVSPGAHTVRLVVGLSKVFGTPSVAGVPMSTPSSKSFALTVGADAGAPIGRRLELLGVFRFLQARRNSSAAEIGLGRNVIRIGVAVRWHFDN